MNFAKFLRTPFLQNTSGRLLLKFQRDNIFALHCLINTWKIGNRGIIAEKSNLWIMVKLTPRVLLIVDVISARLDVPRIFLQNCNNIQKIYKNSGPEVFCEKAVLRNFAKFTGKHLYQSLFLTKLQAWGLQLY